MAIRLKMQKSMHIEIMKNTKILAVLIASGFIACAITVGQAQGAEGDSHSEAPHHMNAADLAEHFAKAYPKIVIYDVNKDGKLDEKEKAALARAFVEGKFELPDHAPQQLKADSAKLAAHIGEVFAQISRYDANHDGVLDATEQVALKSAIEKGELDLGHGKPGHKEGESKH